MSFTTLPNELVYEIMSNLDYLSDLSAMAQTCRSFNSTATQALYSQIPPFGEEHLETMVKNNSLKALHKLIIDYKVDLDMNLLTGFAARFGKIEIMRLLIEVDPTCVDNQSSGSADPPLLCAIINEHFDVADFLLSKGATLQVDSVSGFYPLHRAVARSNLSAVKYIINRKLSDDLDLPHVQTPLNLAIEWLKWDIASYLLQVGADPMPHGADGAYPILLLLKVTSDFDARQVVFRQLLDKGAYADFADTGFWTWLAVEGPPGMISIAMEKLNVGAKVDSREEYLTQLILAIQGGNEQALRGLLADEYVPWAESLVFDSIPWPLSPLALACTDQPYGMHTGCFDVLLEFFSNRLMPKEFEALLLSVCQRACEQESLTVCHHLFERYPLRQDFVDLEEFQDLMRWFTPREDSVRFLHDFNLDCYIDESILRNSTDIYRLGNAQTIQIWFEILKRRGLLVEGNESAFFFAIDPFAWRFESFKLLLDYFKIKLCPSDIMHQSYLAFYLSIGHVEHVRLFLDHGFDVNKSYVPYGKGTEGPMLIQACKNIGPLEGQSELVQLLLDRGASVHAMDHFGLTALWHATSRSRHSKHCVEIIKMLLDRGASQIFEYPGDMRSFTPLEMAVSRGAKQITTMLLDAMTAQNLKFDRFPALILSCRKDDIRKILTQYYWRHIYGN